MAVKNRMVTALVATLIATLCIGAKAQSSDCTSVLFRLSPCLDYISGNSSTPSRLCCAQLAIVVISSSECLCQVLSGGGSSLGMNINQTQALQLPTACNVESPSCNVGSPAASPAGSPSGSPAGSPSGSPDGSPSGSPAGSPSGSPAESPSGSPSGSPGSPTTGPGSNLIPPTAPRDNGSSNAISLKLASPLSFFLLFIATYTSAFTMY